MKSIRIKMSRDEAVFFRQGVFSGEEELLIFSLDDFLEFKMEMDKFLKEALQIVKNSQNKKSRHGPAVDAQRILNWIKKVESELEALDQTDVQKNLNYYK